MPQLHDACAKLRLVGGQLAWGKGVFGGCGWAFGMHCKGQRFDGISRCQQLRNIALGVQYAFALNFCRVCGEYRRHKAVSQHGSYSFRSYSRPAQAGQGYINAAFLGVASPLMNSAAANVVAVFSQIGQVAEVGEGSSHAHGLVAR